MVTKEAPAFYGGRAAQALGTGDQPSVADPVQSVSTGPSQRPSTGPRTVAASPGHRPASPPGPAEPPGLYAHEVAADVVRNYLAEVVRLVNESDTFDVLAHIDYPIRYWPEPQAGPFRLTAFEEEFRHVLRVTAERGKAWKSAPDCRWNRPS